MVTTYSNVAQSAEALRQHAQSRVGHQNRSLYQINTRASLRELFEKRGRPATLHDFPDSELDRLADRGFEWLWFLGMWQTGAAARKISRENPEWLAEFDQVLPNLQPDDITGSCFAVTGYTTHSDFGVVVVNYAANQSQCYVRLPFEQIRGQKVRLRDLMGSVMYQRDGNDRSPKVFISTCLRGAITFSGWKPYDSLIRVGNSMYQGGTV